MRRQKTHTRERSTSKNFTVASHHAREPRARCGKRARARSASRATEASTVIGSGTTDAASGSGNPRNSPKKRRPDTNPCLKMAGRLDQGYVPLLALGHSDDLRRDLCRIDGFFIETLRRSA
jgi:hypothetical protein